MTLIQVCIACKQPISISTTPVYKDNNGDLIYHPKCFNMPNTPMVALKTLPVDIVIAFRWNKLTGDHDIGAFVDCPRYTYTSDYLKLFTQKGIEVQSLYNCLDSWCRKVKHKEVAILYFVKDSFRLHAKSTDQELDNLEEILKQWCSINNIKYWLLYN